MIAKALRGLAALLLLSPAGAPAQQLFEFRNDLAFTPAEVGALAARAYGARLRSLRVAGELDPDPALAARLQRLLPPLLKAAAYERPQSASLAWEVHACARCDENASALPGGKLLLSADFVAHRRLSDDELAYLLAHEIAHVLAEHAREYATAARYFVDNGLRRGYADIRQELDQSLPLALRMEPVWQQQELEADYMGFLLGARAGYAPRAMLSLLDKLGPDVPSVIGTHPTHAQRVQQARDMFDAARRLAVRAQRN
jgi:predicted Zn-dependent protease